MITVFYANMVYAQFESFVQFKLAITLADAPEIYNGGLIYADRPYWNLFHIPGWYTSDGCPYPEDQVDPRIKAWLLLLD